MSQATKTVTLDYPIQRSKEKISELTLHKPSAGTLRGLSLTDILKLEVDAIATLLPRITQPTITKDEVYKLDTSDLVALSTEVATFLVKKSVLEEYNSPIA